MRCELWRRQRHLSLNRVIESHMRLFFGWKKFRNRIFFSSQLDKVWFGVRALNNSPACAMTPPHFSHLTSSVTLYTGMKTEIFGTLCLRKNLCVGMWFQWPHLHLISKASFLTVLPLLSDRVYFMKNLGKACLNYSDFVF